MISIDPHRGRKLWWGAVVFCLSSRCISGLAQDNYWLREYEKGNKLLEQGRLKEAETAYLISFREAEKHEPEGPRLVHSLSALASIYREQGHYT
jgi:hypothetical protein